MNLARIQREMFDVVRTPLTPQENTRRRTVGGKSSAAIARAIIAPNDRLTALERIELYNRQYWWRLLSALMEDFVGLRAIVGQRAFERLATAYLDECGSHSFTLRNLGSRLPEWLGRHRSYIRGVEREAIDMARLEWAEIDSYDAAEEPLLRPKDLAELGSNPSLRLQPYVRLLELSSEADELLLSLRERLRDAPVTANAVVKQMRRSRIRRSRLPRSRKIFLVVHRQDCSNYFKRVEPEAFALLREFQKGCTLSRALAKVRWGARPEEETAALVRRWFSNWSSLGWFVRDARSKGK